MVLSSHAVHRTGNERWREQQTPRKISALNGNSDVPALTHVGDRRGRAIRPSAQAAAQPVSANAHLGAAKRLFVEALTAVAVATLAVSATFSKALYFFWHFSL